MVLRVRLAAKLTGQGVGLAIMELGICREKGPVQSLSQQAELVWCPRTSFFHGERRMSPANTLKRLAAADATLGEGLPPIKQTVSEVCQRAVEKVNGITLMVVQPSMSCPAPSYRMKAIQKDIGTVPDVPEVQSSRGLMESTIDST